MKTNKAILPLALLLLTVPLSVATAKEDAVEKAPKVVQVLPLDKAPVGVQRVVDSRLKGSLAGGVVEEVAELDLKSANHPVYRITFRMKDDRERILHISAPGKVLANPKTRRGC